MEYLIAAILVSVAVVVGLVIYLRRTSRKLERFARQSIAPTGQFAQIGDSDIHYVDIGNRNGRPLVFIHGLGGNLRNFATTLFPLLEGDYRLIALDRAGSAFSKRPDDAEGSLGDHAAIVAGLMDHLGVEQATIVGHSLGGAVALQTALDFPDRVTALSLIAPLTHMVEAPPAALKALAIPSRRRRKFIAETLAAPTSKRRGAETLAIVFSPQEAPDDFPMANAGLVSFFPSHFFAVSTDLVALRDHLPKLEARYDEIACPVGIIFGTRDRILDYRVHGEGFARKRPDCDLEIMEGIGHMPYFPEPDRVAAFIRRMDAKTAVETHQPGSDLRMDA